MHTPGKTRATISKCYECSAPPLVGTRCMKHMTRRIARREKLLNALWYLSNEEPFLRLLTGRYVALSCGAEPGDAEVIIRVFHNGKWHVDHRKQGGQLQKNRVRKIIKAVDRAARREHDRSNRNEAK